MSKQPPIRIRLKKQYAGLKAGALITIDEFNKLSHPIPVTANLQDFFAFSILEEWDVIEVIYPLYFIEPVKCGRNKRTNVVYKRLKSDMGLFYECAFSIVAVPFNNLSNSNAIPLFSEVEYKEYFDKLRQKQYSEVSLDGEKMVPGRMIYFVNIEDGATGQVAYFDGMIDKYPNERFLLYLTATERNNAAYRMCNGNFISDDDIFHVFPFNGAQIVDALKNNEEYEDTDEYWTIALAIINHLKSNNKATA